MLAGCVLNEGMKKNEKTALKRGEEQAQYATSCELCLG